MDDVELIEQQIKTNQQTITSPAVEQVTESWKELHQADILELLKEPMLSTDEDFDYAFLRDKLPENEEHFFSFAKKALKAANKTGGLSEPFEPHLATAAEFKILPPTEIQ